MHLAAAIVSLLVLATPAQWRSDIDYLASELPKRHPNPFHDVTRAEFQAQLDAVKAKVDSMSDIDIALALQRAVASLNDAHTELDTRIAPMTYFPLRLDVFEDGIFVVKTTAGSAAACGAKLVAIDGVPAADAAARAETLISAENEQWRLARALTTMARAEALQFTGVTSASDRARFTFERSELELHAQPSSELSALFGSIDASADWPLYLQKGSSNYWFAWDAARGLMYVKYNLCSDAQPSLASMVRDVFAIADRENVQRFVVDLRNNPGGNSQVVQPLIDALRQRPALRGRLFAIINRRTISSGLLAALDLKSLGATLAGEATGGKPNSYGDQRSFQLPNSRLTVYHSTKYFDLVPGNPAALEPDLPIAMTSDDFFARRDPVLDAIAGPPAAAHALVIAPLRRRPSNPSPVRVCP